MRYYKQTRGYPSRGYFIGREQAYIKIHSHREIPREYQAVNPGEKRVPLFGGVPPPMTCKNSTVNATYAIQNKKGESYTLPKKNAPYRADMSVF